MKRVKTIIEEVSENAEECFHCGSRYPSSARHCPGCGIISLDYITYGHDEGWLSTKSEHVEDGDKELKLI